MQKKNEVFANGLEVACKVADGKSVACFPDPCWSPPGPLAGPVVIPYPNTAFAKDLANGSKTVFISGKPVAQKNKSYFKTSTGTLLKARLILRRGQWMSRLKGLMSVGIWT